MQEDAPAPPDEWCVPFGNLHRQWCMICGEYARERTHRTNRHNVLKSKYGLRAFYSIRADGGSLHCQLCNKGATLGHVETDWHQANMRAYNIPQRQLRSNRNPWGPTLAAFLPYPVDETRSHAATSSAAVASGSALLLEPSATPATPANLIPENTSAAIVSAAPTSPAHNDFPWLHQPHVDGQPPPPPGPPTCLSCRNELPPHAMYCGRCGQQVQPH